MSDRRRQSSRTLVRQNDKVTMHVENQSLTNSSRRSNKQVASETTSSRRRHRSSNDRNPSTTRKTTKRTRNDTFAETKTKSKKQNEISKNNDDNKIGEILIKNKSNQIITNERCPICLDDCDEPKQLDKCSHIYCTKCIDHYFSTVKPQCPCCFTIYGEIRGNQPLNGTMTIDTSKHRLPGFENDSRGTIRITYNFPNGIQDESHPNPGMPYFGTTRQAFLPDNRDGRYVLGLLQKAFDLRQIFTVGQSRTTGYDNVITWNDIHHKTNIYGGVENFGYPDNTYLNRVKQELAAKGIK